MLHAWTLLSHAMLSSVLNDALWYMWVGSIRISFLWWPCLFHHKVSLQFIHELCTQFSCDWLCCANTTRCWLVQVIISFHGLHGLYHRIWIISASDVTLSYVGKMYFRIATTKRYKALTVCEFHEISHILTKPHFVTLFGGEYDHIFLYDRPLTSPWITSLSHGLYVTATGLSRYLNEC